MAIIGRDRSGTLDDLILARGEGLAGESVEAIVPLSHGQRSLWFLHHLAPMGGAYNIAAALRMLSPVDAGALERTFQTLMGRHAAPRRSSCAAAKRCGSRSSGLGIPFGLTEV